MKTTGETNTSNTQKWENKSNDEEAFSIIYLTMPRTLHIRTQNQPATKILPVKTFGDKLEKNKMLYINIYYHSLICVLMKKRS